MTTGVNSGSSALDNAQPIDRSQLARQTQGDADLEREVLELFVGQISAVREALSDGGEGVRRRMAHSLVGASRAIGAYELADAAAALEASPESDVALERLTTQCKAVCEYINTRLR